MKEINQRKTIAVEFDIEEFMLLTAVMGKCTDDDYIEAMKEAFDTIPEKDLGFTMFDKMDKILEKYGK